jgi:hypothetical protein
MTLYMTRSRDRKAKRAGLAARTPDCSDMVIPSQPVVKGRIFMRLFMIRAPDRALGGPPDGRAERQCPALPGAVGPQLPRWTDRPGRR